VNAAIEAVNVSVAYDTRPVLLGVSLSIQRGEVVGIIGPNGAGKSTLLRTLVGLIAPNTGEIRLLGGPVRSHRHRVAYLPQREGIDWTFPLLVEDLVMLGRIPHLGWGRRPGNRDTRVVSQCLEALGISELRTRHIGELSGGQQQRTLLARALAQEAEILLLDEAFMGVDAATEEAILALLARLRHDGRAVLIVDHDLTRAANAYDRLLLLNQRPVAFGPPAQALTREALRVTYAGRLVALEEVGTVGEVRS
jgi:manganese/zinc/iron transport system ATP- binding protein